MEPQQKEQSPNIDSNNHRVNSEPNSEDPQNSPQDSSNQPSQDSGKNIAKGWGKFGINFKFFTKDPIAVVLFVFQLISWTTTVKGAHIIFPKANQISLSLLRNSITFKLMPFVLGSAVQLALIMLLIAKKKKNESIVRRWFMIIVLTAASSYTSFFCFYDALLGGELTENSPKKIQAHESLKNQVYTPLQAEYENLQNQLSTIEKRIEDEINGTRSGVPGIGPIARSLIQERENIQNKVDRIEGIIANSNLDAAFKLSHEDIDKLSTKELYDLGLVAWSSIPAAHKNNSLKPQFSDYENPEAFLLPLERLKAGDKNALAALVIASFIDSSSFILGSIGDNFSLSTIFALSVSGLIRNIKRAKATIRRAINGEAVPFEIEDRQISEMTESIKLDTGITGTDFLGELQDNIEKIDDNTYIIDYDNLAKDEEGDDDSTKKKKRAYKSLLLTLEHHPFKWIEDYKGKSNIMYLLNPFRSDIQTGDTSQANQDKSKKLKIKTECQDAFFNWLKDERKRQSDEEQSPTNAEATAVAEINFFANSTVKTSPNSEET
ncbi:MAG: hypothetical protein AB4352_03605 [Hormoscilla sp.]